MDAIGLLSFGFIFSIFIAIYIFSNRSSNSTSEVKTGSGNTISYNFIDFSGSSNSYHNGHGGCDSNGSDFGCDSSGGSDCGCGD